MKIIYYSRGGGCRSLRRGLSHEWIKTCYLPSRPFMHEEQKMERPDLDCQMESPDEFSGARGPQYLFGKEGRVRKLYGIQILVELVRDRLREKGLRYTLKKSVSVGATKLVARVKPPLAASPRTAIRDRQVLSLDLQPGEMVQVKSYHEIFLTLDHAGKCQGLAFTREMKDFCGQQHRVFRRMELLFNEYTREHRTMKNTVLLEGVYCRGTGFGCDRACFHFWREAWLRRVE